MTRNKAVEGESNPILLENMALKHSTTQPSPTWTRLLSALALLLCLALLFCLALLLCLVPNLLEALKQTFWTDLLEVRRVNVDDDVAVVKDGRTHGVCGIVSTLIIATTSLFLMPGQHNMDSQMA